MARKRMIDPSIWTDEGMAELTPRQQLMYIGMFSIADDDGRLKGSASALALALPTVCLGVSKREIEADICAVVAQMGQLDRYEVDGSQYLEFTNFRKWQVINKPTDSKLPPNPKSVRSPAPLPEPSGSGDGLLRADYHPIEEKRREEKGITPPNARAGAKQSRFERIKELTEAYRDGLGIPENDAGWNTGGNLAAAAQADQIADQTVTADEIRGATAWLLDSWRHEGSRPIKSATPKLAPHVVAAIPNWRADSSPTPEQVYQRRLSAGARASPVNGARAPVPIRDTVIQSNEFEPF
jgi:hypothetical protein